MNKRFWPLSIMLLAVILLVTVAAGCSGDAAETTAEEETYSIKFLLNGEQVASLGVEELQTLPKISINAYNRSEEGPTLASVLTLAGIEEYDTLTVKGMVRGRIATAELILNRSQVTDDVILDFSNRGTCKLAGASIPEDDWIIDVNEIRAE